MPADTTPRIPPPSIARHRGGAEAPRQMREGARRAAVTAPNVHALCLTQLAIAALAEEEWDEATELATRARAQVERYELGAYPTAALIFAASAVVPPIAGASRPRGRTSTRPCAC